MIKAVLFDLDGTLLDRDATLRHFTERQYNRYASHFLHITKEAYRTMFIEMDQKGYVWKDKVYRQLLEHFGVDSLKWEELLEDYVSRLCECSVAAPHMRETLDRLKAGGLALGMITNGYERLQMSSIMSLGIRPDFDQILISETERVRKPDPEIFHRALARLGCRAEEAVYVGDHPVNDAQAALRAGLKAVWIRNTHWEKPQTADLIIEDLLQLPDWLGLK